MAGERDTEDSPTACSGRGAPTRCPESRSPARARRAPAGRRRRDPAASGRTVMRCAGRRRRRACPPARRSRRRRSRCDRARPTAPASIACQQWPVRRGRSTSKRGHLRTARRARASEPRSPLDQQRCCPAATRSSAFPSVATDYVRKPGTGRSPAQRAPSIVNQRSMCSVPNVRPSGEAAQIAPGARAILCMTETGVRLARRQPPRWLPESAVVRATRQPPGRGGSGAWSLRLSGSATSRTRSWRRWPRRRRPRWSR